MMLLFVLCLLPSVVLAQNEAKQSVKIFQDADKNHDQGLSSIELKRTFDKYEADKKEGISYGEYFEFVHSRNPGLDFSLQSLFDIFDANADGVLKQFDFDVMHGDIDKNQNGIVEMKEFKPWIEHVFKNVDKSLRRLLM